MVTYTKEEELRDLNIEVHDRGEQLKNDEKALKDATEWVEKSKILLAEALIAAYKFKKENNL